MGGWRWGGERVTSNMTVVSVIQSWIQRIRARTSYGWFSSEALVQSPETFKSDVKNSISNIWHRCNIFFGIISERKKSQKILFARFFFGAPILGCPACQKLDVK